MTDQQPISPPPELVERLCNNAFSFSNAVPPLTSREIAVWLIEEAYVAGADQELEACCEHLKRIWSPSGTIDSLRAFRRPKRPSLKEQALIELGDVYNRDKIDDVTYDTIRLALEQLND